MTKTNERTLVSRILMSLSFAALVLGAATAQAVVVRTAVAYRPARPVARAAVTTAAVVGTAVAVGTVVHTLPPSCTRTVVGNVTYQQCGSTYYQPRYAGSQVSYIVVAPPR